MKFAKVEMPSLFKAMQSVETELEGGKLVKGSKAYGYKYADLATVFDFLKPAMRKAGLMMIQGGDNGDFRGDINTATVTTFIVHVDSGEWLSTQMTLPLNKATPQDYGAAVTYARRYSLLSIFGLVAEDDDASPQASEKRAVARTERETKATEYKAEKEAQEHAAAEKEAAGRVRQPRGSQSPAVPVSETPATIEEPAAEPQKKTLNTVTDAELAAMEPKDEIKAGEMKAPAPTTKPTTSVPKIEPYSEEQFKPVSDDSQTEEVEIIQSTEPETEAPKQSRPVRK